MYKSTTLFSLVIVMIIAIGCSESVQAPSTNAGQEIAQAESQNHDDDNSTVVPGHQNKYDSDNNGIPDAGIYVTGKYQALYAYDATGDWYQDLGDGRERGNVNSVAELDQSTLTVCDYENQYRADFGNDPFMDKGWIINNINCRGYDDNGTYHYLIVHETDPRYTGNPDHAIWGTWEYHTATQSGQGNLVRPENHVGK